MIHSTTASKSAVPELECGANSRRKTSFKGRAPRAIVAALAAPDFQSRLVGVGIIARSHALRVGPSPPGFAGRVPPSESFARAVGIIARISSV